VKMADIVAVQKGKKPSEIVLDPLPGYRRLLQIDDLRPDSQRKFCPPGPGEVTVTPLDVVIAWDGANAGTSSFGLAGVLGSTLAALRLTRSDVDTRYLGHFLRSQTTYLREKCKGATVPHIDGQILASLEVLIPPLPEQRRIADILDQADQLRTKRRNSLAQLDSLTKSIFVDMFGDPVTNPMRWPLLPLAKVGQVVTGNTPSRSVPEYFGNDIEWIKSDNINTPEYFVTPATEGLSAIGRAVARVAPPSSILVTCIAGSPGCIGNSAMTDRPVAFNQQINALIPEHGDADFIYAQFLVGKRLIQEASTSSMKGMVSKSRFEKVQIISPPVELQRDFATRVSAIRVLKVKLSNSLSYVETLVAALQHQAFRGEL
jgi:type I restriction enzyme S subunit